jgi:hypothetical protein
VLLKPIVVGWCEIDLLLSQNTLKQPCQSLGCQLHAQDVTYRSQVFLILLETCLVVHEIDFRSLLLHIGGAKIDPASIVVQC